MAGLGSWPGQQAGSDGRAAYRLQACGQYASRPLPPPKSNAAARTVSPAPCPPGTGSGWGTGTAWSNRPEPSGGDGGSVGPEGRAGPRYPGSTADQPGVPAGPWRYRVRFRQSHGGQPDTRHERTGRRRPFAIAALRTLGQPRAPGQQGARLPRGCRGTVFPVVACRRRRHTGPAAARPASTGTTAVKGMSTVGAIYSGPAGLPSFAVSSRVPSALSALSAASGSSRQCSGRCPARVKLASLPRLQNSLPSMA